MMVSQKNINRMMKSLVAAIPAIPYVMNRRRTSVTSYVVGGIGLAIAGGIAALMLFSPRTRGRALTAAKDTYGKVNQKVHQFREHGGTETPMSNGLVDRGEYSTTTGM